MKHGNYSVKILWLSNIIEFKILLKKIIHLGIKVF